METKQTKQTEKKKVDWLITLLPLGLIVVLCILFFFKPEQSNQVLSQIRYVFGDTFGTYYLVIGLGVFLLSIYVATSKYGNIVLGAKNEKPKYSFFAWGSMMFTCRTCGRHSVLFFLRVGHVCDRPAHCRTWKYPVNGQAFFRLFHWSLIPWGFYLVLAVAFGFMLHVRNRETTEIF